MLKGLAIPIHWKYRNDTSGDFWGLLLSGQEWRLLFPTFVKLYAVFHFFPRSPLNLLLPVIHLQKLCFVTTLLIETRLPTQRGNLSGIESLNRIWPQRSVSCYSGESWIWWSVLWHQARGRLALVHPPQALRPPPRPFTDVPPLRHTWFSISQTVHSWKGIYHFYHICFRWHNTTNLTEGSCDIFLLLILSQVLCCPCFFPEITHPINLCGEKCVSYVVLVNFASL